MKSLDITGKQPLSIPIVIHNSETRSKSSQLLPCISNLMFNYTTEIVTLEMKRPKVRNFPNQTTISHENLCVDLLNQVQVIPFTIETEYIRLAKILDILTPTLRACLNRF